MLTLVFLSALVAADVRDAVSSAIDIGSSLANTVSGWSSGDGLSGALAIQGAFSPLPSAIGAISSNANDVKPDDIELFASLEASSVSLLKALEAKAEDFQSVGATEIVKGDISEIAETASGAVDAVFSAIATQDLSGDQASSVSSIASGFSSGFSAIGSSFGLSLAQLPTFQYKGGGGSSSSAAETSSAETSSAETTSAQSSAPSSSSVASTSAQHSSPAEANGGLRLATSGAGAVVAAAAALAFLF